MMRSLTIVLLVGFTSACARERVEPAPAASASVQFAPTPAAAFTEPTRPEAFAATAAAKAPRRYRVFGVQPNDTLNIREAPDPKAKKVDAFRPNAEGVRTTGRSEQRGTELWVEVTLSTTTGWVNRTFLSEMREGNGCTDPRVAPLAERFAAAVKGRSAERLLQVVSPVRGLLVHQAWWNPGVRFDGERLKALFTSSYGYRWGTRDGSGEALAGPFNAVIEPALQKAIGKGARSCGDIPAGGTAGSITFPKELPGLTHFSFHAPDPQGGQDWVTYTLGIEYVDDAPYVAALVQYQWEI